MSFNSHLKKNCVVHSDRPNRVYILQKSFSHLSRYTPNYVSSVLWTEPLPKIIPTDPLRLTNQTVWRKRNLSDSWGNLPNHSTSLWSWKNNKHKKSSFTRPDSMMCSLEQTWTQPKHRRTEKPLWKRRNVWPYLSIRKLWNWSGFNGPSSFFHRDRSGSKTFLSWVVHIWSDRGEDRSTRFLPTHPHNCVLCFGRIFCPRKYI